MYENSLKKTQRNYGAFHNLQLHLIYQTIKMFVSIEYTTLCQASTNCYIVPLGLQIGTDRALNT